MTDNYMIVPSEEWPDPCQESLNRRALDMYRLLRATVNVLKSNGANRGFSEPMLCAIITETLDTIDNPTPSRGSPPAPSPQAA